MSDLKELYDGVDNSWDLILEEYKDNINNIVSKLSNYTPNTCDILKPFKLSSYDNIKIIIIGQDPYPKEDTADGLAFSCEYIQSSLYNIFQSLINNKCIDKKPEAGGRLDDWAKRGVLLINTKFTTEIGKSNAHPQWTPISKGIIEKIASTKEKEGKKLLFMLWGKDAQKLVNVSKFHKILTSVHPSPTAQTRLPVEERFYNVHNHFVDAIKFCKKEYKYELKWSCNGNKSTYINTDVELELVTSYSINEFENYNKIGIYNKTDGFGLYKKIIDETKSPQRSEWFAINMCLNFIQLNKYTKTVIAIYINNRNIVYDLNTNVDRWYSNNTLENKLNGDIILKVWEKIKLSPNTYQFIFISDNEDINEIINNMEYKFKKLSIKSVNKVYS